mmetsp:Transcript_16985/g.47001  ORF Transcript_16985/g.47001 Transcript_16985/m.47001 type:complete len:259 (-) Transcript_16985:1090-1866(-)
MADVPILMEPMAGQWRREVCLGRRGGGRSHDALIWQLVEEVWVVLSTTKKVLRGRRFPFSTQVHGIHAHCCHVHAVGLSCRSIGGLLSDDHILKAEPLQQLPSPITLKEQRQEGPGLSLLSIPRSHHALGLACAVFLQRLLLPSSDGLLKLLRPLHQLMLSHHLGHRDDALLPHDPRPRVVVQVHDGGLLVGEAHEAPSKAKGHAARPLHPVGRLAQGLRLAYDMLRDGEVRVDRLCHLPRRAGVQVVHPHLAIKGGG